MSTSTTPTSTACLLDGTAVTIRPVAPEDRSGLHQLLDSLSAQARYLRFLRALPHIPDWAVDSLCRPDGPDHLARIAITDSGHVAGIAQLFVDPTAPATAEVAVTIATPYQRRGLGHVLVGDLAVAAGGRGLDTFSCIASPGNRPALRLMRSLGATSQLSDGLISGLVPIDRLQRQAHRGSSTRPAARSVD